MKWVFKRNLNECHCTFVKLLIVKFFNINHTCFRSTYSNFLRAVLKRTLMRKHKTLSTSLDRPQASDFYHPDLILPVVFDPLILISSRVSYTIRLVFYKPLTDMGKKTTKLLMKFETFLTIQI